MGQISESFSRPDRREIEHRQLEFGPQLLRRRETTTTLLLRLTRWDSPLALLLSSKLFLLNRVLHRLDQRRLVGVISWGASTTNTERDRFVRGHPSANFALSAVLVMQAGEKTSAGGRPHYTRWKRFFRWRACKVTARIGLCSSLRRRIAVTCIAAYQRTEESTR